VSAVDEAVRDAGRSDHDLACADDALVGSKSECRLALEYDEDFARAVPMQARPFPGAASTTITDTPAPISSPVISKPLIAQMSTPTVPYVGFPARS
jgi:hypothetical protein